LRGIKIGFFSLVNLQAEQYSISILYSPIYNMLSFKILSLVALVFLSSSFDQQTLLPTEVSSSALCKWQHPVHVVKQSQLDFIKMEVTTKAQPWTDAYSQVPKDSNKYGKYVSGTLTSQTAPVVS
jgi:hypothetical protein